MRLSTLTFFCAFILLTLFSSIPNTSFAAHAKPNIILIMADDLGYAELGCYGQTKIKTPNIDQLARQGIRFTQFYSGSPVCAPSRCVLLTGKHTGHAYIRNNSELGGWERGAREGQHPLPKGTTTLGTLLQKQGYATAAIGKWGLGGPNTTGEPNDQGFDLFYGYLCQRIAHNYYPTHLWKNKSKHILRNKWFKAHQRLKIAPKDPSAYDQYKGKDFAPDFMIKEALNFIRQNHKRPFFLYYATPVPHVALQVPDDSVKPYLGKWPETPYLGQKAYLPHPTPRAAYAAMVTRMDHHIGQMMKLVDKLKLTDNTIFLFTSDNGPTFNGGSDSKFFNSAHPFRGLKVSAFEGGIRVPLVIRWPNKIKPGQTSHHISALWDVLPTIMQIIDKPSPKDIDGISFLPTLLNQPKKQKTHKYLYWELGNQQAVRVGDFKLYRRFNRRTKKITTMLFNLKDDIAESNNLAKSNPQKLAELLHIAKTNRTKSKLFPSPWD